MASEKNERLINLVIALLAAKRFWTKEEIFQAVEGYDGSRDANDRMFERDKEELRALGIQIEMQSIDPLFEDEIGYRISPDKFRFDLGPLNSHQISVLALAAEAWKESALSDLARSTSIRIQSLGINSDFSELALTKTISNVPENLAEVLETLNSKKVIEFDYVAIDGSIELKRVEPHGIYSNYHRWYLYAFDGSQGEMRSYRLDRISGDIRKTQKSFDRRDVKLPTEHFPPITAILQIRRDYATGLTNSGTLLKHDDDWSTWSIQFTSENEALAQILRNSPNIKALEPKSLVDSVIAALDTLVSIHG